MALARKTVSLATIYNDNTKPSIQLFRSVLEDEAPRSVEHVQESILPSLLGQGKSYEISEPLLEALRSAYVEAEETALRKTEREKQRTEGLTGGPYRQANESTRFTARPFTVDPNLLDRRSARHAQLQNVLAKLIEEHGLTALSPHSNDPDFDLAWRIDESLFIAEIKTTTPSNEARQLRLGLGQVLDYADTAASNGVGVVPVLAVEHRPSDFRWVGLCERHGVRLVWASDLHQLFAL